MYTKKMKALLSEGDCGGVKIFWIWMWKSCNILLKNIRLSLGNTVGHRFEF